MKLATVYLDTNIFSMLHYTGGNVEGIAKQRATQDWWDMERKFFQLYSSQFTETELSRGQYQQQRDALAACQRLPYLPQTKDVMECAKLYLSSRIVPEGVPLDAYHLAMATVHHVDYLLTWNQAHLENPSVLFRLDVINKKLGLRSPLIVSPVSIPWHNMGFQVRRTDEEA